MAYGPGGGWFGPDLASVGGGTAWIVPIPTVHVQNPVGLILLTQCNSSASSTAGGAAEGPGGAAALQGTAFVGVAGECIGDAAAQRISLGTTLYFAIMAAASLASDAAHRGAWGWKVLLHVVLVVAALFLPADAGVPWAETTRGLSAVFLMCEVFVIVDMAFTTHDALARRITDRARTIADDYAGSDEEPGCCSNVWQWVYVVLAAGLWLGSAGVVIGLAAREGAAGPDCAGGTAVLTASLLLALVYTIASLLDCLAPVTGAKGALPPSVLFAFCTWLLVSALGGLPAAACNPLPTAGSVDGPGSAVLAVLVAAISLGYTAYSATAAVPGLAGSGAAAPQGETAALLDSGGSTDGEEEEEEEDGAVARRGGRAARAASKAEEGRSRYAAAEAHDGDEPGDHGGTGGCCQGDPRSMTWLFHMVMLLAAAYMGAALTGWQVPAEGQFVVTVNASTAGAGAIAESQRSLAAFWAQVLAALLAVVLYGWILIAELACPGRSFGPTP